MENTNNKKPLGSLKQKKKYPAATGQLHFMVRTSHKCCARKGICATSRNKNS